MFNAQPSTQLATAPALQPLSHDQALEPKDETIAEVQSFVAALSLRIAEEHLA